MNLLFYCETPDYIPIVCILEPKRSFLPSGTWTVQKYYKSLGIEYQNNYLEVLETPSNLEEFEKFTKSETKKLIASASPYDTAQITLENTLTNAETSELNFFEADVGDTLLPGEGETHPDCLEYDLDNRRDHREILMLNDLKKVYIRHETLKKLSRIDKPVWPVDFKHKVKEFDTKYAHISKTGYKYLVKRHEDWLKQNSIM